MELDDILETSTLPPVAVDVDQALERTSRLGRAHRRRRRGLLGLGAAMGTAVIALALVAVDGDESANVATGPDPETSVPTDPEPGDRRSGSLTRVSGRPQGTQPSQLS